MIVVSDRGEALVDQAVFLYSPNEGRDLCTAGPSGGAVNGAHLDVIGSSYAAGYDQRIVLSQCAPGSGFVILASLSGDLFGCGPIIGSMPLCLCGRPVRATMGRVAMGSSVAVVESSELTRPLERWLTSVGTVHFQAWIAIPAPLPSSTLTNAVSLLLY